MSDLVTSLIDKMVQPRFPDLIGREGVWAPNEPNAVGEHLATIRAVWVDEKSQQLKLLCITPHGTPFETYMTSVKVVYP